MDETIRGEGYGDLYVYFTDYIDLATMSGEDMRELAELHDPMFADWLNLCSLMQREWEQSPLAGKPWCFAYMLVDMMARNVSVGVTECRLPKRGDGE